MLNIDKYSKYTWLCTGDCDALIEYTCKDGQGWPNGVMQYTCPCGSNCVLMSVVPATIAPSTKTKEETKMSILNNLEASIDAAYNPNLLVTYKKITDGNTEYITDKVNDIEWALEESRRNKSRNADFNNKVFTLENMLISAYSDSEDQELISQIADLFDITLTKEVEVRGTISFTATIRVDLADEPDIQMMLHDELSLTSFGSDVDVNDFNLDDWEEN